MISSMSKQKRTPAAEKPRSPVVNVRLGYAREKRLATWMSTQRVEPEKTATILKALDEFLDREGVPHVKEDDSSK